MATHQNCGDLVEDVDGLLRSGALVNRLFAGHCYIRGLALGGFVLEVGGSWSGFVVGSTRLVALECPAQIRILCNNPAQELSTPESHSTEAGVDNNRTYDFTRDAIS